MAYYHGICHSLGILLVRAEVADDGGERTDACLAVQGNHGSERHRTVRATKLMSCIDQMMVIVAA